MPFSRRVSPHKRFGLWAMVLVLANVIFARADSPEPALSDAVGWSCSADTFLPCTSRSAVCPWRLDADATGCQPPVAAAFPITVCFDRSTGTTVPDSNCLGLPRPVAEHRLCYHKSCELLCFSPGQTDYYPLLSPLSGDFNPVCEQKARCTSTGCRFCTGSQISFDCFDSETNTPVPLSHCHVPQEVHAYSAFDSVRPSTGSCPGGVDEFSAQFTDDDSIAFDISGARFPATFFVPGFVGNNTDDDDEAGLQPEVHSRVSLKMADEETPFAIFGDLSFSLRLFEGAEVDSALTQGVEGKSASLLPSFLLSNTVTDFKAVLSSRRGAFFDDLIATVGYQNGQVLATHRVAPPGKVALDELSATVSAVLATDGTKRARGDEPDSQFFSLKASFPSSLEGTIGEIRGLATFIVAKDVPFSAVSCSVVLNNADPFTAANLHTANHTASPSNAGFWTADFITPVPTSALLALSYVCEVREVPVRYAGVFTVRTLLRGTSASEAGERFFKLPDVTITANDYSTHTPALFTHLWLNKDDVEGSSTPSATVSHLMCGTNDVFAGGCVLANNRMHAAMHLSDAAVRARLGILPEVEGADGYTFALRPKILGNWLCESPELSSTEFRPCDQVCSSYSPAPTPACLHTRTNEPLNALLCEGAVALRDCSEADLAFSAGVRFFGGLVELHPMTVGEAWAVSPIVTVSLSIPSATFHADDIAARACADADRSAAESACYDVDKEAITFRLPTEALPEVRAIRLRPTAAVDSLLFDKFAAEVSSASGQLKTNSGVSIFSAHVDSELLSGFVSDSVVTGDANAAYFLSCVSDCFSIPTSHVAAVVLTFALPSGTVIPDTFTPSIGLSLDFDENDPQFRAKVASSATAVADVAVHKENAVTVRVHVPLPTQTPARGLRLALFTDDETLVRAASVSPALVSGHGAVTVSSAALRVARHVDYPAFAAEEVIPFPHTEFIFDVDNSILDSFDESAVVAALSFAPSNAFYFVKLFARLSIILSAGDVTDSAVRDAFDTEAPKRMMQAIVSSHSGATAAQVRLQTFLPWTFGVSGCSDGSSSCGSLDHTDCALEGSFAGGFYGCFFTGSPGKALPLPVYACRSPPEHPPAHTIDECDSALPILYETETEHYDTYLRFHHDPYEMSRIMMSYDGDLKVTFEASPFVDYGTAPVCVADESILYMKLKTSPPITSHYQLSCETQPDGSLVLTVPEFARTTPVRVYAKMTQNATPRHLVVNTTLQSGGTNHLLLSAIVNLPVKKTPTALFDKSVEVKTTVTKYDDDTSSFSVVLTPKESWDADTSARISTFRLISQQLVALLAAGNFKECVFGHHALGQHIDIANFKITPATTHSIYRFAPGSLDLTSDTLTVTFKPAPVRPDWRFFFSCAGFAPDAFGSALPAPEVRLSGSKNAAYAVASSVSSNTVVFTSGVEAVPRYASIFFRPDSFDNVERDMYARESLRAGLAGVVGAEDISLGSEVITEAGPVRELSVKLTTGHPGFLEFAFSGRLDLYSHGYSFRMMGSPFGVTGEPAADPVFAPRGRYACDYGDGEGYTECAGKKCMSRPPVPTCVSQAFEPAAAGASFLCTHLEVPYEPSTWDDCSTTFTASVKAVAPPEGSADMNSVVFEGHFSPADAQKVFASQPYFVTLTHKGSLVPSGANAAAALARAGEDSVIVAATVQVSGTNAGRVNFVFPPLRPLKFDLDGDYVLTLSHARDGSNPIATHTGSLVTYPGHIVGVDGSSPISLAANLLLVGPNAGADVAGHLSGSAALPTAASVHPLVLSFLVPSDVELGSCVFRFAPVSPTDSFAKNAASPALAPLQRVAAGSRAGVDFETVSYAPHFTLADKLFFACEIVGDRLPSAAFDVALWGQAYASDVSSSASEFVSVAPAVEGSEYDGHDVFVRVSLASSSSENSAAFSVDSLRVAFSGYTIITRVSSPLSAEVDVFLPGLLRAAVPALIDHLPTSSQLLFPSASDPAVITATAELRAAGYYQCRDAAGALRPCAELMFCGATIASLAGECMVHGVAVEEEACAFLPQPVPNLECGEYLCRSPGSAAGNNSFTRCDDAGLCYEGCDAATPITAEPSDAGIFEQLCVFEGQSVDPTIFCPAHTIAFASYADTCRSSAKCALLPVDTAGRRADAADNEASWSACSVTCGSGEHSRLMLCGHQDTAEGEAVPSVDATLCDGMTFLEGNVSYPCLRPECASFGWECSATGSALFEACSDEHWSACSEVCAGGVRTRTVACRSYDDTGAPQGIVEHNKCRINSYPGDEEVCNERSCDPVWVCEHPETGLQDDCSSNATFPACPAPECEPETVTRLVICQHPSGAPANDTSECAGVPPLEDMLCPVRESGCRIAYHWSALPASECDTSVAGRCETVRYITVECVRTVDEKDPTPMSDEHCSDSERPASVVACDDLSAVVVCEGTGSCNTTVFVDEHGAAVNGVYVGTCLCETGFGGATCGDIVFFDDLAASTDVGNGTIIVSWRDIGLDPSTLATVLVSKLNSSLPLLFGEGELGDETLVRSAEPVVAAFGSGPITVSLTVGNQTDEVDLVLPALCEFAGFECQHGGECDTVTGLCACVGNYTGRWCEVTPCDAKGCHAEVAHCTDDDGVANCNCPTAADGSDLFADDRCFTPYECIESAFCSNGGVPSGTVDANGTATCTGCACEGNWGGDVCDACLLDTCSNGGRPDTSCESCICVPGHTGTTCECRAVYVTVLFSGDVDAWYLGSPASARAAWATAVQQHLTAIIAHPQVSAFETQHAVVTDRRGVQHVQAKIPITGSCPDTKALAAVRQFELLRAASLDFVTHSSDFLSMELDPELQRLYSALDSIRTAFFSGALAAHPSLATLNTNAGLGLLDPLCPRSTLAEGQCPRDVGRGGRVDTTVRSSGGGLSTGALVGIVIGAAVGGVLLLLLVFAICCGWCCFRKKPKSSSEFDWSDPSMTSV